MAISNFQEKILFFTRQKSIISTKLSNIQMQQLAATKEISTKQLNYNKTLSELYYDPEYGYGTDEYDQQLQILSDEHQFEMSTLNAWESELELQKETLENQLNEITTYEGTWQKLLSTNIKIDFTYGSVGGK